ncbi:MAG: acyltransferase family protein [Candidatus Thermoplasmatota archaeon]|nr:acyltransferase family protein [Candidatus Thermoplasmatota archaeon]
MSLRLNHIDSMRGFAILCMVQVHTAALLPAPVSTNHPLAFISAAIGGMAAPMFVTISGWGLHTGLRKRKERGENIVNWVLVRGLVLISLQFILGILLPQRYNWNSPGILTLLGLCIILIPLISGLDEYFKKLIKGNSGYYKSVFIVLFTILFVGNFPSLSPGPNWDSMIHVKSILHWFQLAFISGTYPILPWIAFYFIGSNLDGNKINEKWSPHLLRSGSLAFSTLLATLAISITEEMNWAETMGEGVLTFFPANHWFVIVSASWTIFLWDIFRLEGKWWTKFNSLLASSGRLSLTIYLLHFALLGQIIEYIPEVSLIEAFVITLLHMGIWLVFGIIHEKFNFIWSIENVIRFLTRKRQSNVESE